MKSLEQAKESVQKRSQALKALGYDIKLGHLYELEAKENDCVNWDTYAADLKSETKPLAPYIEKFKKGFDLLFQVQGDPNNYCPYDDSEILKLEGLHQELGYLIILMGGAAPVKKEVKVVKEHKRTHGDGQSYTMNKHLRAVTSASENLLKHAKSLQHYACDEKLDITLTISGFDDRTQQDLKINQIKKFKMDLGETLTYLHKNLPKTAKLDLSDGSIDFYAKRDGSTIRYNVKIDHTPIPTVTWIEVGDKFHEALQDIFHPIKPVLF
jgi:hypothetical protein